MKREDVIFYSDGLACSAWFYSVEDPGSTPGLVFCPGYTGTKFAAFYQPYIERFVEEGYSVLLIDHRGWGDSKGERGVIYPLWQVADIRNALSYLEGRTEIDETALGVFGVSFGGGNATYAAGMDARIKAGVSVSGVADGASWLRAMRREYEWHEFLRELREDRLARVRKGPSRMVAPMGDIAIPTPERMSTTVKGDLPEGKVPEETPLACADAIIDYRPIDLVPRISPRAMMWIYVEGDTAVPPEQHSISMYQVAGEPKRLVKLTDTTHYDAYTERLDAILEESLAWFGEHIRKDSAITAH